MSYDEKPQHTDPKQASKRKKSVSIEPNTSTTNDSTSEPDELLYETTESNSESDNDYLVSYSLRESYEKEYSNSMIELFSAYLNADGTQDDLMASTGHNLPEDEEQEGINDPPSIDPSGTNLDDEQFEHLNRTQKFDENNFNFSFEENHVYTSVGNQSMAEVRDEGISIINKTDGSLLRQNAHDAFATSSGNKSNLTDNINETNEEVDNENADVASMNDNTVFMLPPQVNKFSDCVDKSAFIFILKLNAIKFHVKLLLKYPEE